MSILPVSEPARRPQLAALAPWQAAAVAVGAGAIALTAIVAPARVLGEDRLLGYTLVGLLGGSWATIGVLGLARLTGLAPAAFFIRRPDRRLLGWGIVGFALAGTVLGAALVDPGLSGSIPTRAPAAVGGLVITGVATGLWSGTVEELFLRGVLLGLLGQRWRWDGAVLVTAMLFGVLHTGAGTTWVGTLLYGGLTGVAGLFLGLVVVATGNVWNAVALHAAWNAAFAPPIVGVGPTPGFVPIMSFRGEPGWLLGAGRSTIAESPLAIALFATALCGYWMRLRRGRDTD